MRQQTVASSNKSRVNKYIVREDNQKAGKSWVWTYDDAGNITSRKEYAYTTGTLGAVQDKVTYRYDNADWGDLLTLTMARPSPTIP